MGAIKRIKGWLINEDIENRLFLILLLSTVPYFVSSIYFDMAYSNNGKYFYLDVSLLSLSVSFFFLSRNKNLRPFLINSFCVILLAGFIFFWLSSEGIKGGSAYVFPMLCVLIMLLTKGVARKIFTGVLIALVFILTSDVLAISGVAKYSSLVFGFILNLTILGFVLVLFKLALDQEKMDLQAQNKQIDALNRQLSIESAELLDYNMEIELIQQNLEKLVDQRAEKLKIENERDVEYSFINAHLVRAPIANMLAALQLMENKNEQLADLETKIIQLDTTVRKIGRVLSENKQ